MSDRGADGRTASPLLVTIVRLMLGTEFLINGLNWWVKLIGPYPSIADFASKPPPPDFVGAMIATGFLFHIVKGLELAAGIALIANRFVPLALVAAFPVTINVFFVDVLMQSHMRGIIMGTGALVMNGYLMLAYIGCFLPMLAIRAEPGIECNLSAVADRRGIQALWRAVMGPLGIVSTLFGLVMLSWVAVMIGQYFSS